MSQKNPKKGIIGEVPEEMEPEQQAGSGNLDTPLPPTNPENPENPENPGKKDKNDDTNLTEIERME